MRYWKDPELCAKLLAAFHVPDDMPLAPIPDPGDCLQMRESVAGMSCEALAHKLEETTAALNLFVCRMACSGGWETKPTERKEYDCLRGIFDEIAAQLKRGC